MISTSTAYLNIIFIFFFVLIISFLLVSLSYILILQRGDFEKISAYECGFQPFEDSREQFDVKFYLVAILFIIFDLEIMFLFPWSLTLYYIGFFGYISMFFFLAILTLGFIYEWKKGALVWN